MFLKWDKDDTYARPLCGTLCDFRGCVVFSILSSGEGKAFIIQFTCKAVFTTTCVSLSFLYLAVKTGRK